MGLGWYLGFMGGETLSNLCLETHRTKWKEAGILLTHAQPWLPLSLEWHLTQHRPGPPPTLPGGLASQDYDLFTTASSSKKADGERGTT